MAERSFREEIAKLRLGAGSRSLLLRGLIKGYGDTHAGGREKYELVARQLPALENHADAAERLSKLLVAANADESGAALRAAIEAQNDQ